MRSSRGPRRRPRVRNGGPARQRADAARARAAEERLHRSERALAQAQAVGRIGSFRWVAGTGVASWSAELFRLVGADPRAVAPSYEAFLGVVHPDDRDALDRRVRRAASGGPALDTDVRARVGAEDRVFAVRGERLREPAGELVVLGTVQDVTEQRRAEQRLLHHALHDPVTGLPNREGLCRRLGAALDADGRAAAVCVGVDRLHAVTDALGHAAADRLLRAAAEALRAAVGEDGAVGRLSGGTFAIVAPGLAEEAAVESLAARARAVFARSFSVDGLTLQLLARAGVARGEAAEVGADGLLRRAEAALVCAREQEEPVVHHAPDLEAAARRRLEVIASLGPALGAGDLAVHYQPQLDLRAGHLTGVEALVRWPHPDRGLLAPDAFLPQAEEAGLLRELTLFVLDAALGQCARWRARGSGVRVAVNLSAVNLLDLGIAYDVAAALGRYGLPPSALELEVTETSFMADAGRAANVLGGLAAMGVRLSIDDFGTGYSSLTYLRDLPVDAVKIDRSFITPLARDEDALTIVRSVIALASSLGLETVAEGVEDAETLERLHALGSDLAQGFHLGRPVPAAELDPLFDGGHSAA